MANPASFKFKGDLPRNLRQFNHLVDRRLRVVMAYEARRAESYAKRRASWTDRTGNARNGLRGVSVAIPLHTYSIIVFHQVPYGIWLEVRFAGRYAIIMLTIHRTAAELGVLLDGLFASLEKL